MKEAPHHKNYAGANYQPSENYRTKVEKLLPKKDVVKRQARKAEDATGNPAAASVLHETSGEANRNA